MTTYRDSRKMSLLFFNTVEWGWMSNAHTGLCIHKKDMGCALYRRLDETHAQSLVVDRLLYTPWKTEWTEKSTIRGNTINLVFYSQHWYQLLCLFVYLSFHLIVFPQGLKTMS
jgi:hypothetical protein